MSGKVRRGQLVPDNDALVQVIKLRPEILQQMLSTVLNIIMFEDCRYVRGNVGGVIARFLLLVRGRPDDR